MKGKAHFQQTLASQSGFEKYSRKSRREEFLGLMESVVPWRELEAVIGPYDPKAGSGRQPVGLSIMLRVYFLPQWSNLSDPGAGRDDGPWLSAAAGDAGVMRPDPRQGQSLSGGPGPAYLDGHDRGCDDHRRALVDEEQPSGARPGDAPDAQGQRVAFWHEGAHRRGLEGNDRALGLHFGGVSGRQAHAARPAAW